MYDVYPLTVTLDKYGGKYSGGAYQAWLMEPYEIPGDPFGSDLKCAVFWDGNTIPVGLGKTMEDAVEDLGQKLGWERDPLGNLPGPTRDDPVSRENAGRRTAGLYPLTVTMDRYGGTYSKGAYHAWLLEPQRVPDDPFDGDLGCAIFWSENTIPVGLGDTMETAVDDLKEKLRAGSHCSENLPNPMCCANINKEKGVSSMNLKEAFRFQSKLKELSRLSNIILAMPTSVVKKETTYLRKKAMPEAEDEVVVSEPSTFWGGRINELVDFLAYLLDQHATLGRAIQTAKAGMELDMDLETGLNSQRQSMASTLQTMANRQGSESLEYGLGTGYCFNAEGNQVAYRFDVKTVTTINFDRNKVRKLAAKLSQQADATSTALDVALVTTLVDYQPPFDVNSTFESVFEQFCEEHGQS